MLASQLTTRRQRTGTCPAGCWPNTSGTCDCEYGVRSRSLRGLGASDNATAIGLVALTGAALLTVHYFFPSHARRARRARGRRG